MATARPLFRKPSDKPCHVISIGGKLIPITDEICKVADLKLDVKNPRLHSELGITNGVTEEELEAKIWKQPDTKQLFQQILGDGGLIEPPFVRPNNSVAEGNRRLVCLRKILFDDEVAAVQPITEEMRSQYESIYIHRIPKEANDYDILKLLLDWHVSSKKPWEKPDQTELLFRLHEGGMTIEELARRTRESEKAMTNRMEAYRLLLKHRKRSPDTKVKSQSMLLSHYREALKNDDLCGWIQEDDNQEVFDGWVANKQVNNVKDTRDRLGKIIKDEAGLEMLTEGKMSVEQASRLIESNVTVFERMEDWTQQMENIPAKHIKEYKKNKAQQLKMKRFKAAFVALEAQLAE